LGSGVNGLSGTISRIETEVNNNEDDFKTYKVICNGEGGSNEATATVQIVAGTPEGLWTGTRNDGRILSGVVTRENKYWLVYSRSSIDLTKVGFYTGTVNLTATPGSSVAGTLVDLDLREVNFETGILGSNTAAGGISSGNYYARARDGVPSFVLEPSAETTYDLVGSGVTKAFSNTFTLSNSVWTGSGTVDDISGVFNTAAFSYTQTLTSPLQPDLLAHIDGSLTLSAAGAIADTYANCTGTQSVCTDPNSVVPRLGVPLNIQANPYNLSNLTSLTWTTTTTAFAPGFGTTTTVANFTATPVVTGVPPIFAGGLTLNTYDSAYHLTAPSLTTVAGSYTVGSTGIDLTLHTVNATFAINASGAITGSQADSFCAYTGTIAAHTTGNLYDVANLVFTNAGGTCVYNGQTFTGVATFDTGTQTLTLTAMNTARDKGFMVIATK
jgi:hypothetical protein